jgi:hypothetical protein
VDGLSVAQIEPWFDCSERRAPWLVPALES